MFTLMTAVFFTVDFAHSTSFVNLEYRYANLLGYLALFIFAVLIVHGFWKPWLRIRFSTKRVAINRRAVGAKALVKAEIHDWVDTHLLLSLFLTFFAGVHSVILFGTLESGFSAYLIGAAAFLLILALGVSGIFLETRRGRKSFKSLNRFHLILTIVAICIAVMHAAASRPGFGLF
jgi:uncharacterized iron-regulated membrane protein